MLVISDWFSRLSQARSPFPYGSPFALEADEGQTTERPTPQDILIQELQHRFANSLQIIGSILMTKARSAPSEDARLHLQDACRRLMSVAATQRQLFAVQDCSHIDLCPYLERLRETLANSVVEDSRQVAIALQMSSVSVAPATAIDIGLIVTELVINALKHAFTPGTSPGISPGASPGLIVIRYTGGGADWRLEVSDNGNGKPADARPGHGSAIVDTLARRLGGQVVTSEGPGGVGTLVSIGRGSPAAHSQAAN